ncbi:beta-ketoacyl-[acyl-carrier-protein] synthase family protein [Micromonospora sp. CPCC 206060]|uniref:beta-ketoacyl-[acyl-carrier-protein] synthase family protein n=1 Tax=Micromonospora sp. CPCC 206060 TaxID=3122406 RepID=UPI002FF22E6B
MTATRVLVTGLGPVTGIGVGAEEFLRGQLAGRSGVRRLTRCSPDGLPVGIAGEVDLPDHLAPSRRQLAVTDRLAHLTLAAARLALDDAGLDPATLDRTRVGVVVGSGVGGMETWSATGEAYATGGPGAVSARFIPRAMNNSAAAVVSIEYGFTGPVGATVTACASGADALVTAHQMLVTGEADVVLAGGADAPLARQVLAGFGRMRALSTRDGDPAGASRPFNADRDGFVLAEGAAILVLETEEHAAARGATGLAEFAGYGRAADGFHITMPQPEGAGAARALDAAMRRARLTPTDVSYVNAHGTGTPYNDAAEVQALRTALGESAARVPVSSTKSQTGHALGAAGAIEAVASVQALLTSTVPATLNLDRPDPAFGLDFVTGEPRETKVTAVLSNSFAFGGHNVVLAFTRA